MTLARAQRLIWPVALVITAAGIGDLVLFVLNGGWGSAPATGSDIIVLRLAIPVFALAFGLLGALVASRRPTNVVGWIFWGGGIEAALQALMTEYSWTAARVGPLPGAELAGQLSNGFGESLFLVAFTLILIFFPDGHLPSPRWRPVAVAGAALILIGGLIRTLASTSTTVQASGPSGGPIAQTLGLPAVIAAIVALVVKFRRADRDGRQQIRLVALAGVIILVALVVVPVVGSALPQDVQTNSWPIVFAISVSTILLLPIAIAVAILRYRLYDIDLVLNRTLAYGGLAVAITVIYVGIVVGIGSLIGRAGQANLILSLAATALVAVAFQPLRTRAQRLANRLVYGNRATPYEVLSRFSERIAETVASDETLAHMARVLAQGTAATQAEVWLRAGSSLHCAAQYPDSGERAGVVAINGTAPLPIAGATAVVPVSHKGELLGALVIRNRNGQTLTPIEQNLMADLAHQAGLALKNVRLAADLRQRLEELRASRERLVTAQDVERRRLERNIHDGAQQNLVALRIKLGLAKQTWQTHPERMGPMLEELTAQADESLNTLRELARGIYPPLLADKGLASALEAQGRRSPIPVQLSSDGAGRYRPDLEAAVYFCCLEALQNAAKYSAASQVQINLSQQNGDLVFEVRDDGRGYDARQVNRGAGLQNMVDRIEALGGTLEITTAVGAGTVVSGRVSALT